MLSQPDWSVNDGQFLYPAIFLLMAVLSRREGNDASKSMLSYLGGLFIGILQVQASIIGVKGPESFVLPQWFVPGFVAGLAAIAVAGFFNLSVFRTEKKSEDPAPSSPRSPRSLIKSYVSSPEAVEDDDEEEEAESTPVKRRGRSPAKRKTPAKKAASPKSPKRSKTPSPRRSPRSRTPRRR